MTKARFKTGYGPVDRVAHRGGGEHQVQQHERDRVDVNKIMARAAQTGFLEQAGQRPPIYADFAGLPDFYDAMNMVTRARTRFLELPSAIRSRFNNDPGQLLDFIGNPENQAEMVELGLAEWRDGHGPQEPPDSPAEPEPAPEAPADGS